MNRHALDDGRSLLDVRLNARRGWKLRLIAAVALSAAVFAGGCASDDEVEVGSDQAPSYAKDDVRRPTTLDELRQALDRTCAIEQGSARLVKETTSTFPGIAPSRDETTWEWAGDDARNVLVSAAWTLPGQPERAPLRLELLRVGDSGFVNLAQAGEAPQFAQMVRDGGSPERGREVDPRMDPNREGCVLADLRTTLEASTGAVEVDGDEKVDAVLSTRLKVTLDEDPASGSTEITAWVDSDGFVRRADWTVTSPVEDMAGIEQGDARTATVNPDERPVFEVPETVGTMTESEYSEWLQRRTSESMGLDPAMFGQLVPTTG